MTAGFLSIPNPTTTKFETAERIDWDSLKRKSGISLSAYRTILELL
jgi:hypothetical protein